ncbi:unnamed protein product [Amoebophrya sp. A120]|nr:unnamed protein product [Amoebophrya sp. A120]|eukprot:GSA120T00021103001.1
MAMKLPPDFVIQRRVKENTKYAEASEYCSKMVKIAGETGWFEQKVKFDFEDNQKRETEAINEELEQANIELKKRRRNRMKLLYENEARTWEAELRELGLAVIRQMA